MASTSSNSPTNIQLRYGYLLLRKNGKILPLVAVDDLPQTVTVLPPLDIVSGIPLLQEISHSLSPRWPERPETALEPAAIQFRKRSALAVIKTTPETTPQNPNGVVQHQDQALSPSFFPPYSTQFSPETSVTDHTHDAAQTHILHPNIFPTSFTEIHIPVSSSSKSSPPYIQLHQQDKKQNPLSTQFIIPSLLTAKSCPTYSLSGSCLCAFRHDIESITKSGQPFTHRANEDPSDGESSSDETSYTSIGEYGDLSSIGGNGDAEPDPVMRQKTRHSKSPKSTEPCAYFHRRIGCKRGKDCFYVHDSTEKDKDGSTRVPGQALGLGLDDKKYTSLREIDTYASSVRSRKLDGKWRRTEKINENEVLADNSSDEVVSEKKRLMTLQISPIITCPTPGRTLSSTDPAKHIKTHCTFFLRFGECDYWPACKFSHERPEGTSRWRGSKLPSRPKRAPANNDGGGQEKEEATNEKERGERSVGRDVKSSFGVARSSGSNSSFEENDDSDIEFTAIDRRKKMIERQLISLYD